MKCYMEKTEYALTLDLHLWLAMKTNVTFDVIYKTFWLSMVVFFQKNL